MKQYQIELLGKFTSQIGIRHIHANSVQEAGDKAQKHYPSCEVIKVKEIKNG